VINQDNTIPGARTFRERDLLRIELQIAKRADNLWRMAGRDRGSDLMHWLQAESEVLGRYLGSEEQADTILGAER
jgi:hypothetical protein